MRRILYIDEPLNPPGGGQMSLLTILKNIDGSRFKVKVFVDRDGLFKLMLDKYHIESEIVSVPSLYFKIKEYDPDLVHINSACTKYTFYSAFFSKILKKPVIWHNRVIETSVLKERLINFFVDRIIVISDAVSEKFKYAKDKVVKMYNPIDLSFLNQTSSEYFLKKDLRITSHQRVIGVFSRVEKWKGHEILLKAFSKLENKNLVLLVCGDGGYLENIKELANRLGLREKVIFTGFVEDVYNYMSLCDIVVNPSVEPEPFGRVIVEAMALGRPVISTDMGGASEIIINNYDGLLVGPSELELKEALERLLTDEELYSKISRNSIHRAEEFDVFRYLDKLYQIYDELM